MKRFVISVLACFLATAGAHAQRSDEVRYNVVHHGREFEVLRDDRGTGNATVIDPTSGENALIMMSGNGGAIKVNGRTIHNNSTVRRPPVFRTQSYPRFEELLFDTLAGGFHGFPDGTYCLDMEGPVIGKSGRIIYHRIRRVVNTGGADVAGLFDRSWPVADTAQRRRQYASVRDVGRDTIDRLSARIEATLYGYRLFSPARKGLRRLPAHYGNYASWYLVVVRQGQVTIDRSGVLFGKSDRLATGAE